MIEHQREAKQKCGRCHELIRDGETMLLIGARPFHRNCGIYLLIGPIQIRESSRLEADAAVLAWEKKGCARDSRKTLARRS